MQWNRVLSEHQLVFRAHEAISVYLAAIRRRVRLRARHHALDRTTIHSERYLMGSYENFCPPKEASYIKPPFAWLNTAMPL
jgi:hypothetical protein